MDLGRPRKWNIYNALTARRNNFQCPLPQAAVKVEEKEEEKAEQVSTPTAPKEEEKTPSAAQEAKGQPATDATAQEDEKPAAVKEAEKSTQ